MTSREIFFKENNLYPNHITKLARISNTTLWKWLNNIEISEESESNIMIAIEQLQDELREKRKRLLNR